MNNFKKLGIALNRLEAAGVVTSKIFLLKHNGGNTDKMFLYHPEGAIAASNDLTELACLNGVQQVLDLCPLLTADDIESYSPQGATEKAAFFEGLFESTQRQTIDPAEIGRKGGSVVSEAKKASSAENGKKGGRPKKQ